ncbi:MAG: TonB-dependent receptor, partial [bacterium]|nr:TonB-dependent receptor [bacterium]
MQRQHFTILLALVLLTGVGVAAYGQSAATLDGTVSDSSAAVIPGVEIRLVNSETGEAYATSSSATGNYTIPFIKPGTYDLTAESAGFKRFNQTGIGMETSANARIDITLELGEVTETITVEASVPLLKTSESSVGSVVQNKTIANMPLINRRAAQLARLNGFMVQNGTGSVFAMAGGRGNNAMWTVDGGSAQNILLGVASLNYDPPIEALEEFSVSISNYKAEMGRTGGGFVQMTTKSGTNSFHGALYEFLRNDAFDARQFFAQTKPVLRRNQFGWAFGGPIKKDRTFFFASQEFTRQTSQAVRTMNIPAPAELLGDFSGFSKAIKDPVTKDPIPGHIIPQSQLDPVGAKVAEFFPAPNVAGAASRNRNFIGNETLGRPGNTLTIRLDHSFSDRHRVFGRYLHNLESQDNGNLWPQPVHNNDRDVEAYYYNWSVTGISNFTPNLIAEYRYTGNQRKWHPTITAKGMGFTEQIGLKGVDQDYFGGFRFTGGIQGIGRTGGQERRQFPIKDMHFVNNFTFVKGNHTIKWGWEYRKSQNDDVNLPSAGGNFNFNSNATGDSIAALLYGWAQRGRRVQTILLRSNAAALGSYVQTDWKVTPTFTLNLGLRWELDWPRYESLDNRQNSFDRATTNPVCDCPGILQWSGRDGMSRYAHNFDKNNFGPRFGFAWRPTSNWVIRGGYSVVYAGQYDQATPIVANAGFSINGDFLSPDGGRTAAFLLRDGLPDIIVPTESDLTPAFGS